MMFSRSSIVRTGVLQLLTIKKRTCSNIQFSHYAYRCTSPNNFYLFEEMPNIQNTAAAFRRGRRWWGYKGDKLKLMENL